jgi:hypothetical protein
MKLIEKKRKCIKYKYSACLKFNSQIVLNVYIFEILSKYFIKNNTLSRYLINDIQVLPVNETS